jgi:hypothetical protein
MITARAGACEAWNCRNRWRRPEDDSKHHRNDFGENLHDLR